MVGREKSSATACCEATLLARFGVEVFASSASVSASSRHAYSASSRHDFLKPRLVELEAGFFDASQLFLKPFFGRFRPASLSSLSRSVQRFACLIFLRVSSSAYLIMMLMLVSAYAPLPCGNMHFCSLKMHRDVSTR